MSNNDWIIGLGVGLIAGAIIVYLINIKQTSNHVTDNSQLQTQNINEDIYNNLYQLQTQNTNNNNVNNNIHDSINNNNVNNNVNNNIHDSINNNNVNNNIHDSINNNNVNNNIHDSINNNTIYKNNEKWEIERDNDGTIKSLNIIRDVKVNK